MDRTDLERVIDAELKALPAPRAPRALLPRVMAATVTRAPMPWYARPWLAWPRHWQLASAATLVALGVLLAMLPALAPHPAGTASWLRMGALADLGAGFGRISSAVEQAATLSRVLWRVLLGPTLSWLLIVVMSLSLACAAVWSALERAAVER